MYLSLPISAEYRRASRFLRYRVKIILVACPLAKESKWLRNQVKLL
jgi:hypothetical protein